MIWFSASTADAEGYLICLDKMWGGHDKVSVPDHLGWECVAYSCSSEMTVIKYFGHFFAQMCSKCVNLKL